MTMTKKGYECSICPGCRVCLRNHPRGVSNPRRVSISSVSISSSINDKRSCLRYIGSANKHISKSPVWRADGDRKFSEPFSPTMYGFTTRMMADGLPLRRQLSPILSPFGPGQTTNQQPRNALSFRPPNGSICPLRLFRFSFMA